MSYKRKVLKAHLQNDLEHIFMLPEGKPPFPAVLLFHEYTGLNSVTISHARKLAEEGYAVLAADFYGISNRPANIEQASTTHRIYRNDRNLMRTRAEACLQALADQPEVDVSRINALGFSFGGGATLELARTGAKLNKAISVYGYLDTSRPVKQGDIKCSLLALHVLDDPVVPKEHTESFKLEMSEADVEYEIIEIQNARHGFANPDDDGFDEKLTEWMWEKVLRYFDQ